MLWFTWLHLLYCIIYISLHHSHSQQFIQSALLKPSSISTLSGISVSTSPAVQIINDKWSINVATQQGSDLAISLDHRWGFHPFYPSSLQLHITGNTSNETLHDDGELLFIFSVENEYFTEMVSLDKRKTFYKECPNSHSNLLLRNMDEMINSITPDRYHRFCNNSVSTPSKYAIDYWNKVGTTKLPAQWPMFISITNNPILNSVQYSWTDRSNALNRVSSQYTSSFGTQQGINIHISGDNKYEDFYIFSIDVSYRYNIPTTTISPSINPTNVPSVTPTKLPSHFPSKFPSKLATFPPSLLLANTPTNTPTFTPTFVQTVAPQNTIITEIISHNSTVIVVVMDNNNENSSSESGNSWFQAFVIILCVFVCFTGWLAFCGFVYFTKHKKVDKRKESVVQVSVHEGMHVYDGNPITESDKGSYKSESALIADENAQQRIPTVINELDRNINASGSMSEFTQFSMDGSSFTSQPGGSDKEKEEQNDMPMLNAIAIINNDIHNPMDSSLLQSETEMNDSESESESETGTSENDSFIYEPGNNIPTFPGLHLQHSIRQQQLYKHKAVSNYGVNVLQDNVTGVHYKQGFGNIDI